MPDRIKVTLVCGDKTIEKESTVPEPSKNGDFRSEEFYQMSKRVSECLRDAVYDQTLDGDYSILIMVKHGS